MWPATGCGRKRARCSRGPSACIASCSGRRAPKRGKPAWEPPVDILETEFEVLALVALPGVDAEKVEAVIEDGELVIAGTRAYPADLRTAVIHRLELPQGRFYRRLRLPAGRYSAVRRAVADGCLVITLQKVGVNRG